MKVNAFGKLGCLMLQVAGLDLNSSNRRGQDSTSG